MSGFVNLGIRASAGGGLATLPAGIDFTGGAAYSFDRMVDGYSGATAEIVKSNGTSFMDVGFGQNGACDIAPILTWNGGTLGNLFVARFYDQTGNASHMPRQPVAVAPEFKLSVTNGWPVSLVRDIDFSPARHHILPGALRNIMAVTVYKAQDHYTGDMSSPTMPGISVGANWGGFAPTDGQAAMTQGPGLSGPIWRAHQLLGTKAVGILPTPTRHEVLGYASTGTGVAGDTQYVVKGGRSLITKTGAIAIVAGQVPAGGRIGCNSDGNNQNQAEITAIVLAKYGGSAQLEAVRTALSSHYSLWTHEERRLWCVGDSITGNWNGGWDNREDSWPVLLDKLQSRWHPHCYAHAGYTTTLMNSEASHATRGIDQWKNELGSGKSDVFILGGYNDLRTDLENVTAATLKTRLTDFCTARKAAPHSRVWGCALIPLPSYSASQSARWDDVNTWLRAGNGGFDAVCDPAALSWTGKFQGDNTHLNAAGNAQFAQCVADFLSTK
jgi:lysophospholipase L1-like esterase